MSYHGFIEPLESQIIFLPFYTKSEITRVNGEHC